MSLNTNKDELKKTAKMLLSFEVDDIKTLSEWISNFPKGAKAPRGMTKEKSYLDTLRRAVEVYHEHGLLSDGNIKAVMSYLDEDKMDEIVDKFLKTEKTQKITYGRISFHNESAMSEKRFKDTTLALFEIIKGLKGYHRLAIEKPLDIKFKSSKELSSKAVYKSIEDEVWIKENQARNLSEAYAYLPYILIHELGHRVEYQKGLPSGFSDVQFFTTNYSKAESFSGSEAFAECFALSHWKEKYPQYKDKLERFEQLMKAEFLNLPSNEY